MYDKEKDLFNAFAGRRLSRRELLAATAKLGVATSAAHSLLGAASTAAMAADFDWMKYKGKSLKLLLSKHPYSDAMIADLDSFKSLTGMDVSYDLFPEDVFFDRLAVELSSKSDRYDAFMTGAYMTWTYGPAGWVEDLKPYLADAGKTNPHYNWNDILPGLRASTAWNGIAGAALGTDDAKQWCIPWGYELNSISYNRRMYDKLKMQPPNSMAELIDGAAKFQKDAGGPYGVGVRGSRSWATIHPGFLSGYTNFGQKDFTVADGKLTPAMNTRESKEFHRDWVRMIQQSGPRNWSTYTWYQVGADLGAGLSGLIYDADVIGYFANDIGNAEADNIGYHAFKPNPAAAAPTPNVWIWSLAMSRFSKQKDAAWYWMQWASSLEHGLFGARTKDFINPVRATVADDSEWHARIAKRYPGYIEQLNVSSPGAQIYFTPQPLFFNVTTEWASTLRQMVSMEVPVDEGLDRLAQNVAQRLKDAGLG
ncbi:ABC transporter substrate-binding protein [Lichenifustis flavocetrariae]|uniref:Extracellular solute-binding protein n=1 Tax=Lichenifustis flavocetrariae TaxID=2949735 RepID=A0AA41YTN1_9HYPH|nr:extracellular solute-binding protein [Lichenifustis flavocetrariae]MCW6506817.1 extracellular solute-binding protein [Lichenifustis flavocetrariae]